MDWQSFLQWFFIIASGASIFGGWLASASRKNGNETRELLKELHKDSEKFMIELHKDSQIILNSMDKRANERHQDVLEILKK